MELMPGIDWYVPLVPTLQEWGFELSYFNNEGDTPGWTTGWVEFVNDDTVVKIMYEHHEFTLEIDGPLEKLPSVTACQTYESVEALIEALQVWHESIRI